jgi:hypothetical protein
MRRCRSSRSQPPRLSRCEAARDRRLPASSRDRRAVPTPPTSRRRHLGWRECARARRPSRRGAGCHRRRSSTAGHRLARGGQPQPRPAADHASRCRGRRRPSAAQRPLDRPAVRVAAADPDRRARLLNRARQERHVVDREVLAAEGVRLARPQPRDDLERLVEQLSAAPGVAFLAEVGEARVRNDVVADVTEPDTQHGSAFGELIDGGDLARDVPRPPARERSHLDTEDEPARAHGNSREHWPRRTGRHRRVALVEDVVLGKDSLPARRLRALRELDEEPRVAALPARR